MESLVKIIFLGKRIGIEVKGLDSPFRHENIDWQGPAMGTVEGQSVQAAWCGICGGKGLCPGGESGQLCLSFWTTQ